MVDGFHGVLFLSAKRSDLLSDGKTPNERRFGEPFGGPIIPFGLLVEYYPISAKDQSRINDFGKKVSPQSVPRIRIVRGVRGGFHGVSLLSAKYSRHHMKGGSRCPLTDQ